MIPPKRFDIAPPRVGDAQKVYIHVQIFLLKYYCSTGTRKRSLDFEKLKIVPKLGTASEKVYRPVLIVL